MIQASGAANGVYNIKSYSTGQYLEISGGSTQVSASLALATSFTNSARQQFTILDPCGAGNYIILNVGSGMALEADCGKPTSNGCAADQYTYSPTAVHHRWVIQWWIIHKELILKYWEIYSE